MIVVSNILSYICNIVLKILKSNPFIRSFVSLLLISVFVLSITPKKTIHSWIADHIDQSSTSASNQRTMIAVYGYHCNTDNLVAESPFNIFIQPFLFTAPSICSVERGVIIFSFYSLHHFYSELRGPPVA